MYVSIPYCSEYVCSPGDTERLASCFLRMTALVYIHIYIILSSRTEQKKLPHSLIIRQASEWFVAGIGQVVFHGPKDEAMPFFESLGFHLPERKGVADFLQEVTSEKDQKVCIPFDTMIYPRICPMAR